MKKSIQTLAMGIIAISLLFAGCKKGDKGDTGAPGVNGNANVISYNYPINSWTANSTYWYSTYTIPALSTPTINSNAAVSVFFSTDSGNNWFSLPYTQVSSTNYFMYFKTYVNGITIFWQCNSGSLGTDANAFYGATVNAKVVVIPPAMKKPGINYNSYAEVKAAYNLKD